MKNTMRFICLLSFLWWVGIAQAQDLTPPAAPTNLTATAGIAQVQLDWGDNSEGDLAGYNVYRKSVNQLETAYVRAYKKIAADLTSSDYLDTNFVSHVPYEYVVTAVDANGNESAAGTAAFAQPGLLSTYVQSEESVSGTQSGSVNNLKTSNNAYETITEVVSGNTSLLEHKWTFEVPQGELVTLILEAYHSSNSEGDDFVFAWSTNDVDYTDITTVIHTAADNVERRYSLPNDLSGTVTIRVTDKDRTAGNTTLDNVTIDMLYIVSEKNRFGPLPRFTYQGPLLHPDDVSYFPGTSDMVHPSVIDTEGRIPDAKGKYYMYHSPHGHDGVSMAYAESIAGPWTAFPSNLIPNYAAADIRWVEEDGRFYMWCHKKNSQTVQFWTTNGIDFTVMSPSIKQSNLGPTCSSATYTRMYEYPLEQYNSKYIMLYSAVILDGFADTNDLTGVVTTQHLRSVWLAVSSNARNWTQLPDPLVSPIEGDDYEGDGLDIYGPAFFQWEGKNYVTYQDHCAWRGGNLKYVELDENLTPVGQGGERFLLMDPPSGPPIKNRYRGSEFYTVDDTIYLVTSGSQSHRFIFYGTAKIPAYNLWAETYGGYGIIGSETNDYDGDGLANLAEYALGGNPTNGVDAGQTPVLVNSGGSIMYVHPQRTDDSNLVYTVETSTNLVSGIWTNAGYVVSGTKVTGLTFNDVTNTITINNDSAFTRLKLEK